jgi:hypothetical protein
MVAADWWGRVQALVRDTRVGKEGQPWLQVLVLSLGVPVNNCK